MHPSLGLSGLEHLLTICRAHRLRAEDDPTPPGAPHLPETLFGQAVDPLLREVTSRYSRLSFGDLYLYTVEPNHGTTIEERNRHLRELYQQMPELDEKLFEDVLLFASFSGFPYYLATVPSLAGSNGLQPVVFMVEPDREVTPIASNVDMAFELYARFLKTKIARDAALIAEHGSLKRGYMAKDRIVFPDSVPEIIAADQRLVELLEANRFEIFTKVYPNLPAWSARVLQAARGRM